MEPDPGALGLYRDSNHLRRHADARGSRGSSARADLRVPRGGKLWTHSSKSFLEIVRGRRPYASECRPLADLRDYGLSARDNIGDRTGPGVISLRSTAWRRPDAGFGRRSRDSAVPGIDKGGFEVSTAEPGLNQALTPTNFKSVRHGQIGRHRGREHPRLC